jgi:hypothetical protein
LFVQWCKRLQKNSNLVVGKHILQLQILTLIWCAIHQTNLRTIGSMMLTLMSCICCEPDTTGIVGFPPDMGFQKLLYNLAFVLLKLVASGPQVNQQLREIQVMVLKPGYICNKEDSSLWSTKCNWTKTEQQFYAKCIT